MKAPRHPTPTLTATGDRFEWDPLAIEADATDPPTLESIGTYVPRWAWALDDTTPEPLWGQFYVPPAEKLDADGDVTFKALVRAKTPPASAKKVAFDFYHNAASGAADSDPSSGAFEGPENSGEQTVGATAGYTYVISWSVPFADLGWIAGQLIRWHLDRDPSPIANLSGDLYFLAFQIETP